MKTAREVLTTNNEKEGWPTDDDSLREALSEAEVIWNGDPDVHRWYHRVQAVVEFNGVFIKFWDYVITGDNSMSDMGLEYDLDAAKIVQRKEREVVEVYYE